MPSTGHCDLYSNDIGAARIANIAGVLPQYTSLVFLDLGDLVEASTFGSDLVEAVFLGGDRFSGAEEAWVTAEETLVTAEETWVTAEEAWVTRFASILLLAAIRTNAVDRFAAALQVVRESARCSAVDCEAVVTFYFLYFLKKQYHHQQLQDHCKQHCIQGYK